MRDIVSFLREHEPFASLPADDVAQLAGRVEIEFFSAGELIFEQSGQPQERVRIVVSGAVELLDHGRPLDLLGPGELFGHPSMLAGLPTGFAARAQEDTLCYRLVTELLVPLLTRPEGLRYVARSLLSRQWRAERPSAADALHSPGRTVGQVMGGDVVVCSPQATIKDVAQLMADRGADSAIVEVGDGVVGIVTDQDLRVRVVAGDLRTDAPVTQAMTAPAHTTTDAEAASDVMIEMINLGVRHLPVLSSRGAVVGIVSDLDLLASETSAPLRVRRQIARATGIEELVATARQLRPTVIGLHDAGVPTDQLSQIIAAFADALVQRALVLLTSGREQLPALTWLATGSMGRREAFPSSDVDCALAWEGSADGDQMRQLAGSVLDVLARCAYASDEHAVTAAHPLFARSADSWRAAVARWLDHPEDERLLLVVSVLADRRAVFGTRSTGAAFAALQDGERSHPLFMSRLRRLALDHRPPTGFLRELVVEHSGERGRRLDLKRGGLMPIVDLARYLAIATGSAATSTRDRLAAAERSGALAHADATALQEALNLFSALRMEHQIAQLRRGEAPTDVIDVVSLNPLTRRYVREAFRTVARAQRALPMRVPT